jgi:hypothetical protein
MSRFFFVVLLLTAPISVAGQTAHPPVITLTNANAYVTTVADTGSQNDYAPVEFTGQPVLIRANNSSDLTITGLAYPLDGQEVTIVSVGSGNVFFTHEASSTSANQLTNTATSGQTPLAAGKGWVRYLYDGTTAKWRMVGHEQGAYIAPAFNSAAFTANGSMTWTVESGDVTGFSYYLSGRQLTFQFYLVNTSVGGTPDTLLQINMPGGFTIASQNSNGLWATDNNALVPGRVWINNLTIPRLALQKSGNWTISTNTTQIGTFIVVEVN